MLFLSACAITPAKDTGTGSGITPSGFGDLYPGALETTTLHFVIRGYDYSRIQELSKLTEEAYEKIMTDTGLYSFKPEGQYPITLYKDHEEYLKKTGMPEWSAGAAAGNALFIFDNPRMVPTLVHEMTHLIYHEFMQDRLRSFRWLNEGLAMYEEITFHPNAGETSFLKLSADTFKSNPLPFQQWMEMIPQSEEKRMVNLWYLQSESVVHFLIERGGRLGFSIFLKELKNGKTLDEALSEAFVGKWDSAASLERAWKESL